MDVRQTELETEIQEHTVEIARLETEAGALFPVVNDTTRAVSERNTARDKRNELYLEAQLHRRAIEELRARLRSLRNVEARNRAAGYMAGVQ